MQTNSLRVTLIGLGNMGSAISENLLAENFELTIYNRTPEKAEPLIKMGANLASSIPAACKGADIVITSLFNDEAEIIAAKEIVKSLKNNAIHIGTATILPETAKALTQLHINHNSIYVGGAVLGVPDTLRAKAATTLAAGPNYALKLCEPIFRAYSARILNLGEEAYKSNVMKICSNYLLTTTIQCMGELYAFAEKSEFGLEHVHELFNSIFVNKSFLLYADKIKDRDFDKVNFSLDGGYKDISLFEEAFNNAGVVPDLISLIKNKFVAAKANGLNKKDWSAVTEMVRMQAGIA